MGTRRDFLKGSMGTAADGVSSFFGAFRDILKETARTLEDPGGDTDDGDEPLPWLRPPGALPEEQFLSTCTRCDECVKACPHYAIRKMPFEEGPDVQGTPIILPRLTACRLCEDLPCIAACEPKALLPLKRTEVKMGLARIDESKCYAYQGQPCDYCVTKCPLREEAIFFDEEKRPHVKADGCTGCGVCVEFCPVDAVDIFERAGE